MKKRKIIQQVQNELKKLNDLVDSIVSRIPDLRDKRMIAALEKNKELYIQKIQLGQEILKKMGVPSIIVANKKSAIQLITIEWSDLTFGDGFITIRFRGKWLERFPVKNAKKSLNAIKSHYKFRNAPKLNLEISQDRILRIVNIEVLFYYIQFFENAGTHFDKHIIRSIPVFGKYKAYTKSYYKKHLPELFQSRCFSLLCEFANDELPIIPVPETVINSNGLEYIHDSFLFPLAGRMSIYWLWESIEESKATYLFQTTVVDFESQLQLIYDYLTGETVNKRETLINSPKLKVDLGMVTRIMHTDFDNWKNEVKINQRL